MSRTRQGRFCSWCFSFQFRGAALSTSLSRLVEGLSLLKKPIFILEVSWFYHVLRLQCELRRCYRHNQPGRFQRRLVGIWHSVPLQRKPLPPSKAETNRSKDSIYSVESLAGFLSIASRLQLD
ncbi:hypothetical protein BDZ45DRAFT_373539 [Acephala macrosclerotiorum]|nr:hypothetical protein BDZ45DRAFT_373539 [Acephala macrosclerotiorum]